MGLIIALGSALAASTGCKSKIADENEAFHQQNRELQARNRELEDQLRNRQDSSQQVSQMQQELAARDAKISDLESQLRQPQAQQTPAENNDLKGIEVTKDDRAGTIAVNLPGDVLFDSGKATLKESAKSTLNKVVSALKKDFAGKHVYVDGYTDTDPISRTKDQWKDNLDLSAARARTVSQYLVAQGLDGHKVDPRAMGATSARQSKERSRRVEIVVATR